MLKQENLAANFCGLLTRQHNNKKTAIEWRILGQEQDGSMLASWISLAVNETPIERSHIGLYDAAEKSFHILHSFEKRENCIQATVNSSRTMLAFVLKETSTKPPTSSIEKFIYKPFIVEIKNDNGKPPINCKPTQLLSKESVQQIMVQFLRQKKTIFEKTYEDKLLLFIHNDTITMLKMKLAKNDNADDIDGGSSSRIDLKKSNSWYLDTNAMTREVIVKHFIWAQWDPTVQALYYIHLKATMKSSLEKDDEKDKEQEQSTTTTLSAHQFHENLPRETVVS